MRFWSAEIYNYITIYIFIIRIYKSRILIFIGMLRETFCTGGKDTRKNIFLSIDSQF